MMKLNTATVALFLALQISCSTSSHITKIETQEYSFTANANTSVDSDYVKMILPYSDAMAKKMDEVIAMSDHALEKNQPEGMLGDFAADACLHIAEKYYQSADGSKIDFCFLNNGGLRGSLPKGNITRRNIFELMPFENELAVLTLNGSLTKKLFDFMASRGGDPLSNARYGIHNNAAQNIFIKNNLLDTSKTYRVLTSDYLANGGDQFFFLTGALKNEKTGLKVRDAIIEFLEERNKSREIINVQTNERVKNE